MPCAKTSRAATASSSPWHLIFRPSLRRLGSPEEQQGGAAESIAAIQELHTKLAQLEAAYGPTPGCKQCEEAQECELSSCPECDAEFGPTSAEPSAATREVRHG